MNNPFIATIIEFGGNFAPRGWAFCDGALMAISSNTALFSILGTTYGGDGRTTFALPDLRGRVAIHAGRGPGLTDRRLGTPGGTESNVLNATQLPSHNHSVALRVNNGNATTGTPQPGNAMAALGTSDGRSFSPVLGYSTAAPNVQISGVTSSNVGGGQSVQNMEPFLGLNYIIALVGVYPSRS